LYLLKYPEKYS